ncbi:hypothetical protein SUGI_0738790 [Cryptomeria japonica]|nr:hypothetical protein SUGI_0738790 [Cryptomeria japonica]
MDDIPIIKLPQVQKLPKSITWVFLARNKRVEDDIQVQKKGKKGKFGKFSKGEDYLLLSTIQHHGLSEIILDCLSEELEAKPDEIKARYDSLLKQDQQKHNNTVDLENKLEVAMDSFDRLFCRQCLVFDCQLHYDSQGPVLPSEKQPRTMPSEEYCNIPCGIHCHKLQAPIVDGLRALNLGSDISQTTSMDVSESMGGNNICSRIDSNPSCDKSVVEDGWQPATIKNKMKVENEPETLRNSTIKTQIKELKIHSQLNFLHGLDDGGWSTLEKDLYEKGVQIFGRNSCLIAVNLLSGLKTCAEIAEYMHYKDDPMEIDEVQTRKSFGCVIKKPRLRQCVKREATPISTDGNDLMPQYTPCKCQSACGDGCSCLQKGTYCEKYCGCARNCKKRYRGCHCVKSQCMTRNCPCFADDRECDPDICQNCWIG